MSVNCSECHQPLESDMRENPITSGPDGDIHYRCFKRMQGQGKEISLDSLMEDVGKLKRRVQELERTVQHHDRSIDFKIG